MRLSKKTPWKVLENSLKTPGISLQNLSGHNGLHASLVLKGDDHLFSVNISIKYLWNSIRFCQLQLFDYSYVH